MSLLRLQERKLEVTVVIFSLKMFEKIFYKKFKKTLVFIVIGLIVCTSCENSKKDLYSSIKDLKNQNLKYFLKI